jgi:hypothetical protein
MWQIWENLPVCLWWIGTLKSLWFEVCSYSNDSVASYQYKELDLYFSIVYGFPFTSEICWFSLSRNHLLNPKHILPLQANIWIIIFSYVGNYFWTHYFFTVLGASYTFPSWRMNNVRLDGFSCSCRCSPLFSVASLLCRCTVTSTATCCHVVKHACDSTPSGFMFPILHRCS